jgi:dTDP-4-amino-4,6-dideoxygalactose transaminase
MRYDILFEFERDLAEYTGAPYAVVTDSCTHALELCFRLDQIRQCRLTAFTYLSIPQMLNQLGVKYTYMDDPWIGEYEFYGTRIMDSARRLERGMYQPGRLQCLSFGNGKPMTLGRAGAILLDDEKSYQTLSMMRSDGRDLRIDPWIKQQNFIQGYHYCPTLETCLFGIQKLPTVNHTPEYVQYPDLREIDFNLTPVPTSVDPAVMNAIIGNMI